MLAKIPATTIDAFATILLGNFTVVVLVCGGAERPASGSELQDLQQQQTGHGAEAFLQQEAISKLEEKLVHPWSVCFLQLLSDAMQLQHQAVHLKKEVEEISAVSVSVAKTHFFYMV